MTFGYKTFGTVAGLLLGKGYEQADGVDGVFWHPVRHLFASIERLESGRFTFREHRP